MEADGPPPKPRPKRGPLIPTPADKFAWPPMRYMMSSGSPSLWKPRINYKETPGISHTIRTRMTTKLNKPIPEDVYTDLRNATGPFVFELLATSIDIQPKSTKKRPATGPNAELHAAQQQALEEAEQETRGSIYQTVWDDPLHKHKHITPQDVTNKLLKEAKLAKIPASKKVLPQPLFRKAGKIPSSFDEWFEEYGETRHAKTPMAKLVKYGPSWTLRTGATQVGTPQTSEQRSAVRQGWRDGYPRRFNPNHPAFAALKRAESRSQTPPLQGQRRPQTTLPSFRGLEGDDARPQTTAGNL